MYAVESLRHDPSKVKRHDANAPPLLTLALCPDREGYSANDLSAELVCLLLELGVSPVEDDWDPCDTPWYNFLSRLKMMAQGRLQWKATLGLDYAEVRQVLAAMILKGAPLDVGFGEVGGTKSNGTAEDIIRLRFDKSDADYLVRLASNSSGSRDMTIGDISEEDQGPKDPNTRTSWRVEHS